MHLNSLLDFRWAVGILLVAGSLISFSIGTASAQATLTIGSKAPPLNSEHWLCNRDGELPEVTTFEKGNFYVLNFWATNVRNSLRQVPRLSQLQDDYLNQRVHVISISREKLASVQAGLKKNVIGNKDKTFAELFNNHSLTVDPDKSVSDAYIKGARRTRLPASFIIGKTGEIEWMGEPKDIEEPLKQILAGRWDRRSHAKSRELLNMARAQAKQLAIDLSPLTRDKKSKAVLKRLDQFIKQAKKAGSEVPYNVTGMRRLASIRVGGKQAVKTMDNFAKENSDDAVSIYSLAKYVYNISIKDKVDQNVLGAAVKYAQMSAEMAKREEFDNKTISSYLDTQAHLLRKLKQLDEAIEIQTEAVELHDSKRGKKFLNDLLNQRSKERKEKLKQKTSELESKLQ